MRQAGRISKAPGLFSKEDSSTLVISQEGDILIQIKHPDVGTDRCYRCSRDRLRSTSEYFNVLLNPTKFSEGIAAETRLQDLKRQYKDPATIPAPELPKLVVTDIGDLPKACRSADTVVTLLFKILHDCPTKPPTRQAESVNLLALLAIVADRFACADIVGTYLVRQRWRSVPVMDRKTAPAKKTELGNRKKLLAGLIFGYSDWVYQCSATLIVQGSIRQTVTSLGNGEVEGIQGDDGLWWRLPGGVEEELACRREYVLETFASIQKHFIGLYTSRQPQCRLGYSSSPQCDSYQLGEMIRFFSRKGTLRMESVFDPAPEDHEPYNGNLDDIVTKLMECPSYQIDSNHTHCGLRTRLMSILEGLRSPRPFRQVGLCLECWRRDKSKESWLENPVGGLWTNVGKGFSGRSCEDHNEIKAMYTATKRDWTPSFAV